MSILNFKRKGLKASTLALNSSILTLLAHTLPSIMSSRRASWTSRFLIPMVEALLASMTRSKGTASLFHPSSVSFLKDSMASKTTIVFSVVASTLITSRGAAFSSSLIRASKRSFYSICSVS